MQRYVITSQNDGVFVGHCLGLGFWSKLDSVGQDSVPTFESNNSALDFVNTWDTKPDDILIKPVTNWQSDSYASIDDLAKSGIEF